MSTPTEATSLFVIKMAHTAIWAFFISCILAIYVFAWQAKYGSATLPRVFKMYSLLQNLQVFLM